MLCEETLLENLSPSNVATYLYLAHLHEAARLKVSALDFCKLNHQNIVKVSRNTRDNRRKLSLANYSHGQLLQDSQWKRIESEFPSLYVEAISCVETPEPCHDHLRCIADCGTRYTAEKERERTRAGL